MFRQFQQFQATDSSSSTSHASSAQLAPSVIDSGTTCPLWLLDSGASLHMTPDATYLSHCHTPHSVTRVRIADGTPLPITSVGHLTTSTFSVPSLSHVPSLSMSLMSASQLTDYDCQVI